MHKTESIYPPILQVQASVMLSLMQNKHTVRIGVWSNVSLDFSSSYLTPHTVPSECAYESQHTPLSLFTLLLKLFFKTFPRPPPPFPFFLPAQLTPSHIERTLTNSRDFHPEMHRRCQQIHVEVTAGKEWKELPELQS